MAAPTSTSGHGERARLPEAGAAWEDIETQMRARARGDVKWREGRTAVYVFNAGEDVRDVGARAYTMFMSENGLGPAAFPSLAQMEREVVDFGLDLLNAPDGAGGDMTSGGTDSILMAMKTCRDWWRAQGRDTVEAEIVAPETAHPAFDKAAHVLNLAMVRVPVGQGYVADAERMEQAVGDRTLALIGSVPCFPYGLVDPIHKLGEVAERRGLWLHVDACVGGYFAPFAVMNGVDLAPFDFRVPAVRSISADLHKYGYVPKGASTVLYRDAALRDHQIFSHDVWPNGRMTTPTLSGTRPGGAIAGAWAVMNYLGRDGYRAKAADVIAARQAIEQGAAGMGFSQVGRPELGLTTLHGDDVDTLAIADAMRAAGWFSSRVANPDAIHLMLSPAHRGFADTYLAALREARDMVVRTGTRSDGAGRYG